MHFYLRVIKKNGLSFGWTSL